MAIVRSDHWGDETGNTKTCFSPFFILENESPKYQLLLTDEHTLGEQKESASDFYVKSYDRNAQYTACCARTQLTRHLDHTWITYTDKDKNNDEFTCGGGHSEKEFDLGTYSADDLAYSISDYCRGKDDTNHVSPYGLDGVCHQMANRFLYPVGVIIPIKIEVHSKTQLDIDFRPKGYVLSTFAYGSWGISFKKWLTGVYANAKDSTSKDWIYNDRMMTPETLEYELEDVYMQSETVFTGVDAVLEETRRIFRRLLPAFQGNPVEKEQRELINNITKSANSAGIFMDKPLPILPESKVVELCSQINDAGIEFQTKLKEKIGLENYSVLFVDTEIQNMVDFDDAKKIYCKK